jgi:hypothetical protein
MVDGLSGRREEIERMLDKGGYVLFLGAGVAAEAGLPLWGRALESLANELSSHTNAYAVRASPVDVTENFVWGCCRRASEPIFHGQLGGGSPCGGGPAPGTWPKKTAFSACPDVLRGVSAHAPTTNAAGPRIRHRLSAVHIDLNLPTKK